MNRPPESGPSLSVWLRAQRGIPRAMLEHLLLARLDLTRATLLLDGDRPLSQRELEQLQQDVRRLQDDVPLGYVLGVQPFRDLNLRVDSRVLVPRPETELLVDAVLNEIAAQPAAATTSILDLGTGSGAIAIALARALPGAVQITAVDRCAAALELAASNAGDAGVAVRFHCSDWFTLVEGQFQIIVSNPPYVADTDPHLWALRHEPVAALRAGVDGLQDLRTIIHGASAHLTGGGALFVEHGSSQGQAVRQLFTAADFIDVRTDHDYAGHERITQGRRRQAI